MDKYKQNIESIKAIIPLAHCLDDVNSEEEQKIVKWLKEDIKEICIIQNTLKETSLLKYAYINKRVIDINKLKKYIQRKDILKIYNIINIELNSWRDINMCIQTCYNKIKIS